MSLVCWQCGATLNDIPRPFVRLEQCRKCHADLHVCRMCRFYNPRISDKCDHDMAEPARDIDVANFCHYYKPRPDAFNQDDKSRSDAALDKLKAMFGDNTEEAGENDKNPDTSNDYDDAKKRFNDLFKD